MRIYCSFLIILFCACQSSLAKEKTSICLDKIESKKVIEVAWNNLQCLPKIDGDWAKMEGYFSFNFEDIAIYSSKESKSSTGIWINFKDEIEAQNNKLKKLIGKKVMVYGRINVNDKGHLNGYKASLDSVYCIEEE